MQTQESTIAPPAAKSTTIVRLAVFLIGAFFLVSALAKTYDLRGFWIQMRAYGIITAPTLLWIGVFTVVAAELLLGLSLTFRICLSSWTFAVIVALLCGFSGLILYGWLVAGVEDCGCLGAIASMSPRSSLVKNAILLAICLLTWRGWKKTPCSANPRGGGARFALCRQTIGVTVILTLFGIAAVHGLSSESQTPSEARASSAPPKENAHPLAAYQFERDGRTYDLSQGDYLVALLSLDCSHCGEDVLTLNEYVELLGDAASIVALCLGDGDSRDAFQYDYEPVFDLFPIDSLEFFNLIGDAPPRYVYLRDGERLAQWDEILPTPKI